MAFSVIIVEAAGHTAAMSQPQAFEYLCDKANLTKGNWDKQRRHLSTALNAVFSIPDVKGLEGKSNGDLLYNFKKTRHASAGIEDLGTSVTLFFYVIMDVAYIFAVGEHINANSYRISHFGQPGTEFAMNAKIVLGDAAQGVRKKGRKH